MAFCFAPREKKTKKCTCSSSCGRRVKCALHRYIDDDNPVFLLTAQQKEDIRRRRHQVVHGPASLPKQFVQLPVSVAEQPSVPVDGGLRLKYCPKNYSSAIHAGQAAAVLAKKDGQDAAALPRAAGFAAGAWIEVKEKGNSKGLADKVAKASKEAALAHGASPEEASDISGEAAWTAIRHVHNNIELSDQGKDAWTAAITCHNKASEAGAKAAGIAKKQHKGAHAQHLAAAMAAAAAVEAAGDSNTDKVGEAAYNAALAAGATRDEAAELAAEAAACAAVYAGKNVQEATSEALRVASKYHCSAEVVHRVAGMAAGLAAGAASLSSDRKKVALDAAAAADEAAIKAGATEDEAAEIAGEIAGQCAVKQGASGADAAIAAAEAAKSMNASLEAQEKAAAKTAEDVMLGQGASIDEAALKAGEAAGAVFAAAGNEDIVDIGKEAARFALTVGHGSEEAQHHAAGLAAAQAAESMGRDIDGIASAANTAALAVGASKDEAAKYSGEVAAAAVYDRGGTADDAMNEAAKATKAAGGSAEAIKIARELAFAQAKHRKGEGILQLRVHRAWDLHLKVDSPHWPRPPWKWFKDSFTHRVYVKITVNDRALGHKMVQRTRMFDLQHPPEATPESESNELKRQDSLKKMGEAVAVEKNHGIWDESFEFRISDPKQADVKISVCGDKGQFKKHITHGRKHKLLSDMALEMVTDEQDLDIDNETKAMPYHWYLEGVDHGSVEVSATWITSAENVKEIRRDSMCDLSGVKAIGDATNSAATKKVELGDATNVAATMEAKPEATLVAKAPETLGPPPMPPQHPSIASAGDVSDDTVEMADQKVAEPDGEMLDAPKNEIQSNTKMDKEVHEDLLPLGFPTHIAATDVAPTGASSTHNDNAISIQTESEEKSDDVATLDSNLATATVAADAESPDAAKNEIQSKEKMDEEIREEDPLPPGPPTHIAVKDVTLTSIVTSSIDVTVQQTTGPSVPALAEIAMAQQTMDPSAPTLAEIATGQQTMDPSVLVLAGVDTKDTSL